MYKKLLAENLVYGSLSYKEEENGNDNNDTDKTIFWEKIIWK